MKRRQNFEGRAAVSQAQEEENQNMHFYSGIKRADRQATLQNRKREARISSGYGEVQVLSWTEQPQEGIQEPAQIKPLRPNFIKTLNFFK